MLEQAVWGLIMLNTRHPGILVVSGHDFETPLLSAYGELLARSLGGRLLHARTGSHHWEDAGEAIRELSPAVVVAAWPKRGRDAPEAQRAARGAQLLLVDMHKGGLANVRRIVAPWSGNPLSLGRLRLASRLADGLDAGGVVLRVVGMQGAGADRQARRRYFRQVSQRDRVELALAGVTLPAQFRVGDDVVGQTLVRIKAGDLVIVGGPNDLLLDEHPATTVSWDIRDSVTGPVAMLIEPSRESISLSDVFQEGSMLMHIEAGAAITEKMVDLLVGRRQVPWSWKPDILRGSKQISLGRRVVFTHTQIPGRGRIIAGLAVEPGPDAGRLHVLVLVPREAYDTYLPVLAQLAQLAADETLVNSIIAGGTPAEVMLVLHNAQNAGKIAKAG